MAQRLNQQTGEWEDDGPAPGQSGAAGQYDPNNPNSYTGSSNEIFNNSVEGRYQSVLGRGSNADEYKQWVNSYDPNDPGSHYGADKWQINAPAQPAAAPAVQPAASPYAGYLAQPAPQPQQTPQGGAGTDNTSGLLDYLKGRQSSSDANNAAMREILMKQISQNSTPVNVDSPGIKQQIAAQHLESQRTGERQRSQLAARLSSQNLSSSGAADTGMNAIEQQRGETDSKATAGFLGEGLQRQQAALNQELQLAVQSGDAEAARQIQGQLQAIGLQLQDQHFGQSQGQQNNQFLDNFWLQQLIAKMGGNAQSVDALFRDL